jgi:hypothetical protein
VILPPFSYSLVDVTGSEKLKTYYTTAFITVVKRFIEEAPGDNFKQLF